MKPANSLSRAEFLLVLLALAGAPLVHWPWIGGSDPIVHSKTVFVVGIVALGLGVRAARLLLDPAASLWPVGGIGALAAGWIVVSATSLLTNGKPVYFFQDSILFWGLLAWLWLLAGMQAPGTRLPLCLHVTALTGIVVALIGAVQALAPAAMEAWLPYAGSARDTRSLIFSTLGNPEYLGGYLAATMTLTVCLILRTGNAWLKAALGLAVVFEGVVLVYSGSRGPWLGAGAGFLAVGWLEWRASDRARWGRLALWATLAGMGAALLLAVFSTPNPLNPQRANLFGRILELRNLRGESTRHRIASFTAAARMVARQPWVGVGPGHYASEFFPEMEALALEDDSGAVQAYLEFLAGRAPIHAHNDYLEIWAETGTLGIVAFTGLIGTGFASMGRAGRGRGREAWAIRAAQAGCVCLLFEALFSFPLHLPDRGILFWTLFGMGAAAGREMDRVGSQGSGQARPGS